MSETQYITIIGTMYLARSMDRTASGVIGAIILLVAAAKGLGWI